MNRVRFGALAVGIAATVFTLQWCGKIGVDRYDEHGMTALMRAARDANRPEVDRLIGRGADVNRKVPTRHLRELIAFISWMQQLPESDIGYTPLHYAVSARSTEVARVLIDKGARITEEDFGGSPPLNLAIHNSDTAMLRLLIGAGARPSPRQFSLAVALASPATVEILLRAGADPNAVAEPLPRYPERPAPILEAARRSDTAIVKLLLQGGANPNVRDRNGWSPLRVATKQRSRLPQAERVVELLSAGGASDSSGMRAKELFDAVHAKDAARVRAALAARANPNARDDMGLPPLLFAASHGLTDITAALIEAGANVNANPQNGTTPLNAAIRGGSLEVVQQLLAAGARVNLADRLRETPLQMAATWKRTEIAALLLASSATIDPGALPRAALAGDVEQVRMLLARGANPNADSGHVLDEAARGCLRRDNSDVLRALLEGGADPRLSTSRALHRASALCSPEIVQLMIDRGANPNARDRISNSVPLISAAASGRADNIRVLLAAGADVNAKDDDGKSALSYAGNYPEVQEALRRARARP